MVAPVRSHRPTAVKSAGRVLQTAARVVMVVVLIGAPLLWGGRHPLAAGVKGIAVGIAALLAVIFSYSRAAILVTTAGLLLFTVGLWWGRRGRSVSLPLATAGVALFIASFYGLDLLFERVAFVLSGTDPSALVRREIWATVLNVIGLSPWLGSGWDGVAALTSTFDTSYIPGFFVNAAHNDYLELAVIVGVPLAVLVCVVGLGWYGRTGLRVAALGRRASSFFPVALGLFLGITGVLAQEAVEYGLKQPANLLIFVAACGALGLVLKAASDASMEPVRQPRLSFAGYGGLAVVMAAAVGMGLAGVKTAQEGWRQAELETVTQAARTNVALSERLMAKAQSEAAETLLAVNPRNVVALAAMVDVKQRAAEALRRESWARALSALLERPVSPRQAERPAYAPYRGQALALIPAEERRQLADGFGAVERAALALARVSPANASAVSMAATAADDRAFWSDTTETAAAWHRYAAALAPSSVTVLARAVRGLALAAAGVDDVEKAGLVRDFTGFAKRLVAEVPSDLTWILPLTENVGMTADEVASLVPERIQGQELYARWLVKQGDYETALAALDRAAVLNDARLEEEKPWTMGRAAYLAREKREKPEVALAVDQLRLSAYEGLGDETAAADVAERIRAREAVLHEAVIARSDALMTDGNWVLADELLKPLKTDPRALVRWAEMALTMNRLEGAGQRMQEYEDVAELADDETRMRAAKVLERLDSLRETLSLVGGVKNYTQ